MLSQRLQSRQQKRNNKQPLLHYNPHEPAPIHKVIIHSPSPLSPTLLSILLVLMQTSGRQKQNNLYT